MRQPGTTALGLYNGRCCLQGRVRLSVSRLPPIMPRKAWCRDTCSLTVTHLLQSAGVVQMNLGILMSLYNQRYFRDTLSTLCEFIPQVRPSGHRLLALH